MPDDRTEAQTRLHLWLTLLAVLAVVAGVGATLVAGRVGGSDAGAGVQSPIDGMLRISAVNDAHLACPSDAAFSPDGSRLVVLGVLATSSPNCSTVGDGSGQYSHVAVIFDGATGQLQRVIPLDPYVRRDSGAQPDGSWSSPVYFGLGWSPDGTRLAFVFTQFDDSGQRAPENVTASGLLLLLFAAHPSAGTSIPTGTILRGDSGFFTAASGVSSGFPVWHMGRGTELPSFLPPPGLAYAWNADGVPYAILPVRDSIQQLPVGAAARYPVGLPDGGSHFTIWQPGIVIGSDSGDTDAHLDTFVSAFPAWAPSGSDVTLLAIGVTFSVGGSGTTMRVTTGRQEHGQAIPPVPIPPNLPVVPARDAALASVLQQVDQPSWAMVAWNPSGSLLGSINCFAVGDETLEVRDTASGTLLATEPLHLALGDLGCRETPDATVVGSYPSLGLGLAWSPQGDRLLVTNRAEGTLTIFHMRHMAASS